MPQCIPGLKLGELCFQEAVRPGLCRRAHDTASALQLIHMMMLVTRATILAAMVIITRAVNRNRTR